MNDCFVSVVQSFNPNNIKSMNRDLNPNRPILCVTYGQCSSPYTVNSVVSLKGILYYVSYINHILLQENKFYFISAMFSSDALMFL